MRRLTSVFAVALFAVLLSASPASGQNLAWSGFYVGGHIGWGVSVPNTVADEIDNAWNGLDATIPGNGGFNWGGLFGYQRALTSKFVVAGEFGIGMNGYNGSTNYGPGNDTTVSFEGGLNWHGLGRVGYNLGRVMPYFTLGVVGISTDVEALDDCNTGSCGGGLAHATASGSTAEFTWGIGGEFGLGIGRHPITIRAEYLWHDFRTIIDAVAEDDDEVVWRFDPHYPQGTFRILVNWRIGGDARR